MDSGEKRRMIEWREAVRHGEIATVAAMLDDWLELKVEAVAAVAGGRRALQSPRGRR